MGYSSVGILLSGTSLAGMLIFYHFICINYVLVDCDRVWGMGGSLQMVRKRQQGHIAPTNLLCSLKSSLGLES